MANTVIALRSSGVASNVPNVSSLANGEVAINFADGILYYKTDTGSLGTIQTAQPSGLDTEIQFNDSGSFGGDSGLTYNKTTNALTVAGNLTSANVTSQSYIQFGDGTRQYTANAGGTAAVTSVAGATGAVSNTQILTGLLTVDGVGSGLDADLLDGVQGSSYVTLTGTQILTGAKTLNNVKMHLMTSFNTEGSLEFNRQDSVNRPFFIRTYNDSAAANNYMKFDVHDGTVGSSINVMHLQGNGNVGIGSITPSYKLEVNGSFAATTKSFVIPHPTKKGKKLRYGSLEGPENGIYVRGQTTERIIKLPAYWTKLVDSESITVNLVSIGEYQQLYVEKIEKNKVYIKNAAGKNINCFYTIFAERADVEKLEVEI